MKSALRITVVTALIGFALASCKKDYVCACTINGANAGSTAINDTKSNAKEECEKDNGTYTIGTTSTTVDCSIQ